MLHTLWKNVKDIKSMCLHLKFNNVSLDDYGIGIVELSETLFYYCNRIYVLENLGNSIINKM